MVVFWVCVHVWAGCATPSRRWPELLLSSQRILRLQKLLILIVCALICHPSSSSGRNRETITLNVFYPNVFKAPCCSCLVAHSCLTFCDPMDYSPSGSSVYGISQARILEWVAISFSRGSSQLRDWIHVSCIGWAESSPLSHLRGPVAVDTVTKIEIMSRMQHS